MASFLAIAGTGGLVGGWRRGRLRGSCDERCSFTIFLASAGTGGLVSGWRRGRLIGSCDDLASFLATVSVRSLASTYELVIMQLLSCVSALQRRRWFSPDDCNDQDKSGYLVGPSS